MKRIIFTIIAAAVVSFSSVLICAAVVGRSIAEPVSYKLPTSLVDGATRVSDWFEGHAGRDR